jgi:23S rRNA (uracil1939-C5)-methyltransferase
MSKRKPKEIEITVDAIATGGKGIARHNGRVVFVENGIPGDKGTLIVNRKKKDYWEGKIKAFDVKAPERIEPPCPYFGHCGGCKWQFIAYADQLKYKTAIVKESLERIGKLKAFEMLPILPSEQQFAYRNKMEFSFSARRWLTPEELKNPEIKMQFALGLHVPGTFEKVMQIDACMLQGDVANKILASVNKWARTSEYEPYHLRLHTGDLRFLVIRYSLMQHSYLVNLVTKEFLQNTESLVAELQSIPEVASVINTKNDGLAQIAFGDSEKVLFGESVLTEQIGRFVFSVSANAFFQTNILQTQRLYDTVVEFANFSGDERVYDLYSGTGTIAIYISDHVREVVGIELIADAVENARFNAQKNNIDNCTFHLGDARDVFADITDKPDVLIVDPPRAGLHGDVVAQILRLQPAKFIYVSCNPATLARDLGMLAEDYHIRKVRPVDMFPQTWHIESVTLLEHKNA